MNALQSKFSKMFADLARPLAESMVFQSAKASSVAVSSSLKELSGGLTIKADTLKSGPVSDILKASVAENVGLIKSIPANYLDNVRGAVMRSITSGNGLQDLVPFLERQEGVTKRRAENIALDQTRKAYQSINDERMKAAGVQEYEWVHSGGGQKPRPHHVEMSGNIYRYDDPPVIDPNTGERGTPGQVPNCRCTSRPVLRFGD
jgi:SPP1 gp7 family putative phage head morphogenesis protein